jgi:imidazole glycerol-phosphate synthase subunit HisH
MTAASLPPVVVVDYGLANIQSVVNALECFTPNIRIAETGDDLAGAARIVLPGVGHFDEGMKGLRERGHVAALEARVLEAGVPLLGICLGLQFLFEGSDEGMEHGLGWVSGRIKRIDEGYGVKVPHMGWSEVTCPRPSRLFAEIKAPIEFYFVHSFCAPNSGEVAGLASATCAYGTEFVAAFERGNIFATQFHPEKSQLAGMKLLETFLSI